MKVLDGFVDVKDKKYINNKSMMEASIEELEQNIQYALGAGGQFNIDRHHKRGKMLPRDRITEICDPGSPFLELSQLAAKDLYEGEDVPSAGMVTGIGIIHGKQCMIVANDATTKGGSYFPVTVKKHVRAQEIAQENNLPCIYLVDSGGANLPKQADVFPDRDHFG